MPTNKERMLAGEPYMADDSELVAEQLHAAEIVQSFNGSSPRESGRQSALADLLGSLGDDSTIRPPFQVEYGYQTFIGTRTFVNFGAVLLDIGRITIDDDVQTGPNVQLLTATHPIDPAMRRAKWEAGEPITIEDNVWLGGGVIVCPGVTIGANTVVGAGAVVTADLPSNVVAAGVPARVVKEIPS